MPRRETAVRAKERTRSRGSALRAGCELGAAGASNQLIGTTMTGRERSVLRIEGSKHSNLKTGASDEGPGIEKPISDLRHRMLEDMAVRRFGEKTQADYIRHVETFAKFLGRSPDTATARTCAAIQVHQIERGVQPPSMNSSAVALRFFFTFTLGRGDLAHHLTRVHYPRKLPRVLSPEDVARLLEAAPGPGLKYKAAL